MEAAETLLGVVVGWFDWALSLDCSTAAAFSSIAFQLLQGLV